VGMAIWSSENTALRETQSPLPDASNVEVVYDISPETSTRATRSGSLLEGLRLSYDQAR
jgi:hypothetical protein